LGRSNLKGLAHYIDHYVYLRDFLNLISSCIGFTVDLHIDVSQKIALKRTDLKPVADSILYRHALIATTEKSDIATKIIDIHTSSSVLLAIFEKVRIEL
jgi:hypothetical protein